ncbi:MAG: family 20 glycosylhydrolase [Bacteroidales bacterium]
MRKLYLLPVLLLVLLTACKQQEKTISIIPVPVSLEPGQGSCLLKADAVILCQDTLLTNECTYFADRLKLEYGLDLPVFGSVKDGAGVVIDVAVSSSLKQAEGYSLEVTPARIVLRGADASGVFYGMQTLFQLLPASGNLLSIPAVLITDYPRFGWRGLHLDVCRHFYGTEFIKRYLDLMARHKLNTFHWHLTEDQGWRIEIKKYPKLTEIGAWRADREDQPWNEREPLRPGEKPTYGGFYTQEQIRDIVAYAQKLHITIVPEIEMPAHAVAALAAYPELSCTGKKMDVIPGGYWPITHIYCAGNEKTFEFLENVLLEVMDLFPSTYIHIGGDEAAKEEWEKCPKCNKRMKTEKLASVQELQSYFIKRMEKFLVAHNRRLIGWDEILEGGLAPEATVMSWRGISGGIAAAQQDHEVVMTPSTHMYFDYYQGLGGEPLAIGGYLPLDSVYSFEPLPVQLDSSKHKYIRGVQANVWTEYIATENHVEYMAYPRACAMAEIGWSPMEKKDYAGFMLRMKDHYDRMDKWGIHYRQPDIDGLPGDTLKVTAGYQAVLTNPRNGGEIRYTLDGSMPTIDSKLYRKPLTIRENTTLKAALFFEGAMEGKEDHRVFLVNPE